MVLLNCCQKKLFAFAEDAKREREREIQYNNKTRLTFVCDATVVSLVHFSIGCSIALHQLSSTPSNIGLSTSTLLNRIPLTLKSFSLSSLFFSLALSLSLVSFFLDLCVLLLLMMPLTASTNISFENSVLFCLFIFNFRTWISLARTVFSFHFALIHLSIDFCNIFVGFNE